MVFFRNIHLPTEWSLDFSFHLRCLKEFLLGVDFFASRGNHKLFQLVSLMSDLRAVDVDAFVPSWERWGTFTYFHLPT